MCASELQALMALRASDAILGKNLAIIRRNLALLDAFVARHAALFRFRFLYVEDPTPYFLCSNQVPFNI